MHEIGADITERSHIIPMNLRVRVIIRPKYACRSCAEAVVQAPAPDSVIPGGLPTEALLAHIAVAKVPGWAADPPPVPNLRPPTASRSTARRPRTGWGAWLGG